MATMDIARSPDRDAKAVDLLIHLCRESFGRRLSSIILYGSAALKDSVPGYSDLDIMLVIEDRLRGPQDHELLRAIKREISQTVGVEIHEAWVFGRSLLLSVPTLWETLSARTIYGEPIIEKASPPELHRRTGIKMMHDLRSSWERRERALDIEEKAKNALNYTLKFAQNALLYYDVVAMKKIEIVESFEKRFKGLLIGAAPRTAYERILHWKEIREDHAVLDRIVNEFERFSDTLFWHVSLKTIFE
ncbi:MAG: hypothetical protein V1857_03435 [archaeon]